MGNSFFPGKEACMVAKELMPFWQWKQEQYANDQAAGTPHTKDWYYRAYGGYCEKMRKAKISLDKK